jgi:uncharacterized protein
MQKRYLFDQAVEDLGSKMLFLTGPRQVGKSTLAGQILERTKQAGAGVVALSGQLLNWDTPLHRDLIARSAWSHEKGLLIFDEIHKMKAWKTFLKGAWDGRAVGQQILVTGSARMDTFRQGGESLAGRYFALRLHPFSVKELVSVQSTSPADAMAHLLERGGFPEPCFASSGRSSARWRQQYAADLIREDVLEMSRVQEIKTLQLFVQLLRERVGSPIKVSNLAQMLQISPTTAARYLDILEALHVVFRVTPWHRDISRSLLKEPKIYFYDIGMVLGDIGAKLENLVACSLHKHVQYLQDVEAQQVGLHTIRDKEGHEIDFVLSQSSGSTANLTDLIEVKTSQTSTSEFMQRVAEKFPTTKATQLIAKLRQPAQHGKIAVVDAADWLNALAA